MIPESGDEASGSAAGASREDAVALEALLQAYLPRLRAFVRSNLVPELRVREAGSDLVQSVCRELLEHRDRFRYRGEAEFRGWLFTAAANKVREKLRFHHQARRDLDREQAASGEAAAVTASSTASPSRAATANEHLAILEAALDAISEGDREVITLIRLAGLPVIEVATLLGKTEVAVRQQLGRALGRLSAELSRRMPDGTRH